MSEGEERKRLKGRLKNGLDEKTRRGQIMDHKDWYPPPPPAPV
jgi:hypothetical protein